MAIIADIDKIDEVLLSDGWHIVADHSFSVDVFEYIWNSSEKDSHISPIVWESEKGGALGFEFSEIDSEGDGTDKNIIKGKLSDIKSLKFYK